MDVVVTVPKSFGLNAWIDEGDLPGEPWSGRESFFRLAAVPKLVRLGDRVYVVYGGKLRGYAPLVRIALGASGCALVRHGGAVAVTIDEVIPGFRGFRYRWWKREDERPFPEWKNTD
jgi:hypothetical protein